MRSPNLGPDAPAKTLPNGRTTLVCLALLTLVAAGCSHENGHQTVFPNNPPPQSKEHALLLDAPPIPPSAANEQVAPLPVGGEVKAPVVLTRVQPAAGSIVAGITFLDVIITPEGAVADVTVRKAPTSQTGKAWADAVRQWTFAPATYKGKPVTVVHTLTLGMDK
jgi:hypothetical protein